MQKQEAIEAAFKAGYLDAKEGRENKAFKSPRVKELADQISYSEMQGMVQDFVRAYKEGYAEYKEAK